MNERACGRLHGRAMWRGGRVGWASFWHTVRADQCKVHHCISNLQCRGDEHLVAHVNLILLGLVQNMREVALRSEFHEHAHIA